MNNKKTVRQLSQYARELVEASRRLDYPAIVAHEGAAISQLRQVAGELRLDLGRLRGDVDEQRQSAYAQLQPPPKRRPVAEPTSVHERRRRCADALTKAGLGARLGKLCCSNSAQRLVPFREAPHRRGLPPFDMVVAADYMQGEGFHGIFITADEVLSGWLLQPAEGRDWQLRVRSRYTSLAEMTEKVGLMSAGFPV